MDVDRMLGALRAKIEAAEEQNKTVVRLTTTAAKELIQGISGLDRQVGLLYFAVGFALFGAGSLWVLQIMGWVK